MSVLPQPRHLTGSRDTKSYWPAKIFGTMLLNAPFHAPHDPVRFGSGDACNGVGTRLVAGDCIAAEFIGIAGGAEVRDIAAGESDAKAIRAVNTENRGESCIR